jgi:hypothetical protein
MEVVTALTESGGEGTLTETQDSPLTERELGVKSLINNEMESSENGPEQTSVLDLGLVDVVVSKKTPKKRFLVTKRRLSEDWTPGDDGMAYAEQNGFTKGQAEQMFIAFQLHHIGRATQWARWDLAWQTWVRNEIKFSRPQRQNGRGGFAAIAARLNGAD